MSLNLRRILVAALPGLYLFVVGCAIVPYAREVKKKPQEGGVVALPFGATDARLAQAEIGEAARIRRRRLDRTAQIAIEIRRSVVGHLEGQRPFVRGSRRHRI